MSAEEPILTYAELVSMELVDGDAPGDERVDIVLRVPMAKAREIGALFGSRLVVAARADEDQPK